MQLLNHAQLMRNPPVSAKYIMHAIAPFICEMTMEFRSWHGKPFVQPEAVILSTD